MSPGDVTHCPEAHIWIHILSPGLIHDVIHGPRGSCCLETQKDATPLVQYPKILNSEPQRRWDSNTINALPGQISLVNDFSGVIRNVTYKIPADQDASLVRASRILCGVPDESLKLAEGFDAAQLWIEVAEQETLNPQLVYTTNRLIFELFRPPNVTGASVLSSPYSGGTTVYVYGNGFRSYLGLSCQVRCEHSPQYTHPDSDVVLYFCCCSPCGASTTSNPLASPLAR